jgi:hypothetical protein
MQKRMLYLQCCRYCCFALAHLLLLLAVALV